VVCGAARCSLFAVRIMLNLHPPSAGCALITSSLAVRSASFVTNDQPT